MPNPAVPNRGTNEMQLDQFNIWLRSSPIYQNFMRQNGLPTDGRVKLSRQQQAQMTQLLKANGITLPKGMHIDQGGNLNQSNRLGRNLAIAGAVAGAAIGVPAALGAFGGAAGAGAGAAGAGAAGATGAGAAGAGTLATTGWVAPLAGYAAPAVASGVGGATAAGLGAAAGGAGLLASAPTATGLAPLAGTAASSPVLAAGGSGVAGAAGAGGWLKNNAVNLGLLGASALGGSQADHASGTSTSTPTLDPAYKSIQDALIPIIQHRLSSPYSLPAGFEEQGINDINHTYDLVGDSLENDLTARGLGNRVGASGRSRLQGDRAGDIVKFQRQIPILNRQYQDQDLGIAQSVLGMGRGVSTTSNQQSGGGVGGTVNNLATMLAFLQGSGAFSRNQQRR